MTEGPHAFLAHRRDDSVGVAVRAVRAGDVVFVVVLEDGSGRTIAALQDIPFGHKLALHAIALGESVRRYGTSIGRATTAIEAGAHVHVHNLKSNRF